MIHQDIQAWLTSPTAMPCILVEFTVNNGTSEVPLYMSNTGYVTESGDTPANTTYNPFIGNVGPISETLSLDGSVGMSYGDIEILNQEGDLDYLKDYVWDNRAVKIFIGDVSWPRDNFKLVFNGIVGAFDSSDNKVFNIVLRDKLQLLNCPLTEALDNEILIPVTFGEVSNITPLLVDAQNLTYKVHTRSVGGIIEVRDNGAPVEFTEDLANGEFSLSAQPFGVVTCSVHGDANTSYVDDISSIVKNMILDFGSTRNTLTTTDIDNVSFTEFSTDNPQCVGVFYNSRVNLLTAINDLTNSLKASIGVSKLGLIKFYQIKEPSGTPVLDITDFHIIEDTFEISEVIPVIGSSKIAYNRNYTVQNNLANGIPEAHKEEFYEEYKYASTKDSSVVSKYKLYDDAEAIATSLQVSADAYVEANRLLNLFKTPRYLYRFEGTPELLLLEVGDVVSITTDRFGLSGGSLGIITGLDSDWTNNRVTVEIFV